MSERLRKYLAQIKVQIEAGIVSEFRVKALQIADDAMFMTEKDEAEYFKTIQQIMKKEPKRKPTKDPTTGETMSAFSKVKWAQLEKSTQWRKERLKGSSFATVKWVSGESTKNGRVSLASYLKTLSVSKSFDYPELHIIDKSESKKPNIKILITPGLARNMKNLNAWDNALDGDKNQDDKINARKAAGKSNEQRRPLFAPMREYFVRQRIPRKINEKLKGQGYATKYKVTVN